MLLNNIVTKYVLNTEDNYLFGCFKTNKIKVYTLVNICNKKQFHYIFPGRAKLN